MFKWLLESMTAMAVTVFSVIYSSTAKAELPVVEDSCDQELMDSINLSSQEFVYKKTCLFHALVALL